MAEIEIGVAQRQYLSCWPAEKTQVERELNRWSQARNASLAPTDWQFTTKDACVKLKRLFPSSTKE